MDQLVALPFWRPQKEFRDKLLYFFIVIQQLHGFGKAGP